MIECRNISRQFVCGETFYAAKDISVRIEKGEFVAITGKSGSGKSTLMNMIGLIDAPTTGEIIIDGHNVSDLSEKKLAEMRNRKIGYIFQSFFLDNTYTVCRNVEMPMIISNTPSKQRILRVDECLNQVGLIEKKNAIAGKLSGGEMQRVCIARAIANNPDIILADEPCGNLDSSNTERIMNILCELNKEGKTIILVTHSMDEAEMAQKIIHICDGRIKEIK